MCPGVGTDSARQRQRTLERAGSGLQARPCMGSCHSCLNVGLASWNGSLSAVTSVEGVLHRTPRWEGELPALVSEGPLPTPCYLSVPSGGICALGNEKHLLCTKLQSERYVKTLHGERSGCLQGLVGAFECFPDDMSVWG